MNEESRSRSQFNVICEEGDEGGYFGQGVELPAAISQGATLEELESNMKEAIDLVLQENTESVKTRQLLQITV